MRERKRRGEVYICDNQKRKIKLVSKGCDRIDRREKREDKKSEEQEEREMKMNWIEMRTWGGN